MDNGWPRRETSFRQSCFVSWRPQPELPWPTRCLEAPKRMEPAEQCLRLRVYFGESDQWERRPLYEAIVLKARRDGLAGATVFRSPMGFGATSRIHTAKILNLSTDLPIVVEIIDTTPKIEAFLASLEQMIQGGMVTVEPIKVVHYRHEKRES